MLFVETERMEFLQSKTASASDCLLNIKGLVKPWPESLQYIERAGM